MLRLTFNPGLALTGFGATRPCVPDWLSLDFEILCTSYWTNERRYTDETLLSYATNGFVLNRMTWKLYHL